MNTKRFLTDYGPMFVIWLILIFLFGSLSDHFLSSRTLSTIAGQVPPLVLVCCGMTFILIVAGIDLSVGSVLAFCATLFCLLIARAEWAVGVAAIAAILAGGFFGLINGLFTVLLRVPSFIVTLGTLKIAFGMAMLISRSETLTVGMKLEPLISPLPGPGVPVSFIVAVLFVIAGQFVLSKTIYGRHLIAIGTNESAVRLAGVETTWKKISVFVVTGLLTGVAAIFFAARLGGANADSGNGFELSAIAAVVIGGTSLMGGRGSIVNSFLGVLIILTLDAGLAQVGADEWVKHVITGAVIILAVLLDVLRGGVLPGLAARIRNYKK
ncbi:MAG: ABC transporter permease [Verrucomicrobiales bacterium]|nr:ABC transporter permease [Verrucomicrobiales bacterium]